MGADKTQRERGQQDRARRSALRPAALIKANRIQEKAANVGFDWEKPEQVWDKVREEASEVELEIKSGRKDALEAEFGDLLLPWSTRQGSTE